MRVIVAGGAQVLNQKKFFNIGKRNDMAVRKMFHRNNVFIDYRDVDRTVKLAVKYREVTMKVSGRGEKEICMI